MSSIIGAETSYYVDIVQNLPSRTNKSTPTMLSQRNRPSSIRTHDSQSDAEKQRLYLEDDLLVVSIWTIMGVFGLVTNFLILTGICQNKKLRQSTSYWLVMSLSLCDLGMLVVCLAHLIPSTILHERYVRIVDFQNAFGVFVYDAFWYTGVLHLMLMSMNRYVNICRPKHYLDLFSRTKTCVVVVCLYLLGITLAIPGLFSCCYLVYNYQIYAGQYEPSSTPYRYMDMAVNGASVLVMTFCYSCIVVRVRRSRIMLQQYRKLCREQATRTAAFYANKSTAAMTAAATIATSTSTTNGGGGVQKNYRQNSVSMKLARLLRPHTPVASRREVRLFFQFATVSIIFFLTFFTWSWLPHLSSDSKWIGFVVTSLFFVNNCINPIVYLIFNTLLRRQIRRMFCVGWWGASSGHSEANIAAAGGIGGGYGGGNKEHAITTAGVGGGHAEGGECYGVTGGSDARGGGAGGGSHSGLVRTISGGAKKPHKSFLRRLRSTTASVRRTAGGGGELSDDLEYCERIRRRRSITFEPDDDARLLRTSIESYNDTTTDNATDTNNAQHNATCNLMAMAAFLNTTTITGGVLLRTIQEDEERKRLMPRVMAEKKKQETERPGSGPATLIARNDIEDDAERTTGKTDLWDSSPANMNLLVDLKEPTNSSTKLEHPSPQPAPARIVDMHAARFRFWDCTPAGPAAALVIRNWDSEPTMSPASCRLSKIINQTPPSIGGSPKFSIRAPHLAAAASQLDGTSSSLDLYDSLPGSRGELLELTDGRRLRPNCNAILTDDDEDEEEYDDQSIHL